MYHVFVEDDATIQNIRITSNGDFLCVQYDEHPLHVYRRMAPDTQLHPCTARTEYAGTVYMLDWIEDEKE